MSVKRFVQLFVFYLLSIVIAIPLTNVFNIEATWLYYLVISIIGFFVLSLPLTIMTIQKSKK
ncbi:hypothetical protein [Enterococcus sp.]|uniref:hypothetical protein n=1 Tax=Enterococcus sp. TaxID=35783 RepID=UPI002FCA4E7A